MIDLISRIKHWASQRSPGQLRRNAFSLKVGSHCIVNISRRQVRQKVCPHCCRVYGDSQALQQRGHRIAPVALSDKLCWGNSARYCRRRSSHLLTRVLSPRTTMVFFRILISIETSWLPKALICSIVFKHCRRHSRKKTMIKLPARSLCLPDGIGMLVVFCELFSCCWINSSIFLYASLLDWSLPKIRMKFDDHLYQIYVSVDACNDCRNCFPSGLNMHDA